MSKSCVKIYIYVVLLQNSSTLNTCVVKISKMLSKYKNKYVLSQKYINKCKTIKGECNLIMHQKYIYEKLVMMPQCCQGKSKDN